MIKFKSLLLIVSLFIVIPIVIPTLVAFQGWEKPTQPPSAHFTSLAAHPFHPEHLLAASQDRVFEKAQDGQWRDLRFLKTSPLEICRLLTFPNLPMTVFALTNQGFFLYDLQKQTWREIFLGGFEKDVSSLVATPFDSEHWFVGTSAGLLESDDGGKSWSPVPSLRNQRVSILKFTHHQFYAATDHQLLVSQDLIHFREIFSLPDFPAEAESFEALDENPEPSVPSASSSKLRELIAKTDSDQIWLATDLGVFESPDGGESWERLPQSGLKTPGIEHLVWSERSRQLFAGTSRGVYRMNFPLQRWEELFEGMTDAQTLDLALIQGKTEKLLALTETGLMEYPLPPDLPQKSVWIYSDHLASLFQKLVRLEPKVQEIHREVIRHNDAGQGKITRWQMSSRLRALVPTFSFGKDFSKDVSIDLDRGTTNEPDKYILGPDDIREGWDWDVSWDLGDFIWSSNQTSIDSRSKLNTELRHELLAEATRLYYERRRLQTEIVFSPAPAESLHFDRLIRMDELTALLDGVTDGFLSRNLNKLYSTHPELEQLWQYLGPLKESNSE